MCGNQVRRKLPSEPKRGKFEKCEKTEHTHTHTHTHTHAHTHTTNHRLTVWMKVSWCPRLAQINNVCVCVCVIGQVKRFQINLTFSARVRTPWRRFWFLGVYARRRCCLTGAGVRGQVAVVTDTQDLTSQPSRLCVRVSLTHTHTHTIHSVPAGFCWNFLLQNQQT